MFVFELTIPGTWLNYEDRDWNWKIEGMLRQLESHFFEVNTALNLFINASNTVSASLDHGQWERDSQRRREIQLLVEQEMGQGYSRELWEAVHLETEIRFKREQWSKGRTPRELESHVKFIHARAFLYALDTFDKFLGVLSRENDVPDEIREMPKKIAIAFPHLREVRNTAHHLEDRSRGLGKSRGKGKAPEPLDLKPIDNEIVHAPNGGVLILNSLNGTRYGSTMADGHYGEVDVSAESMSHLQSIMIQTLQAFKWHGPMRHAPSL